MPYSRHSTITNTRRLLFSVPWPHHRFHRTLDLYRNASSSHALSSALRFGASDGTLLLVNWRLQIHNYIHHCTSTKAMDCRCNNTMDWRHAYRNDFFSCSPPLPQLARRSTMFTTGLSNQSVVNFEPSHTKSSHVNAASIRIQGCATGSL